MDGIFNNRITSLEQLEELRPLIGYPGKLAANKVRNALDSHSRAFIAKSPFLLIATSDADGHCDVSPRGDGCGFVHLLDDRHLFIPERPGNRRLDSIRNLLTNPGIGLIFLIPGLEETFRVNGRACVSRDPELLERTAVNGKLPTMGIGVEIEECYVHCAKAFKRSGLWQPGSWLTEEERPSAAQMVTAHVNQANEGEAATVTVVEVEAQLQESYTKRLY